MKVELSIHGLQLPNVAGAFKGTSDPFAVVTKLAVEPGAKPQVLGKTEVVKNSLSPQWVKVFTLDYDLGTPCKVAINIFDEVKKGDNKSMGTAVFDIGELLGARGNSKAKKLQRGGTLYATVRKAQGSGLLRLGLKGCKLKNVEGMFSKSDPFFELSRKVSNAGGLTWDNVFRSEHIKNTLDPTWETTVLELGLLCGGDLDLPIRINVFDHESSGKHKNMGQAEMSVNGMIQAASTSQPIKLMNKNNEVGTLIVVKAEVSGVASNASSGTVDISSRMAATSISQPMGASKFVSGAPAAGADFVDYISGGCELNCMIAIDFTGSNGDPRQPGTLHYIDPNSMNDYEKAISSIVSVIAKYDSDQKFPVVGFGAKYGGLIQHCFQVGNSEQVYGVQGVLDAYNAVFCSGLVMSGPTVFTDVIRVAASRATASMQAAQQRGLQTYTILLILTDGAVSDAQETAAALQQVADSPLSIVIVGVGNADFSAMQFLDDVGGKRDIVQFVEFNKHARSPGALTSETLREIPNQLTAYFTSKGIRPLPPMSRSDSMMSIGAEEGEIDLTLDIKDDEIIVTGGGNDFASGFGQRRYL